MVTALSKGTNFMSQSAKSSARVKRALVFDACHVGVVLRAVLFVECVLAVGCLYGVGHWRGWLERVALLTGGALPATLAWLIVACSVKRLADTWGYMQHGIAGVVLGALAGLLACAMLVFAGVDKEVLDWGASMATGALLAALLVAALIWRARARAPAAVEARLKELQSRIRPHFLFNTLNGAIALVREEPAKAEALLEDLSELFRYALVELGESATLGEEIELARRYLDIEQVRFSERMRVLWELDERANEALLPPLLLQPLVENAVKHGVEPSSTGGKLRISTERRGLRVRLTITNTLPSESHNGQASRGHGIALANVRDRLHLLHDVDCSFSASVHKDKGLYQVRILLPLK